MIVESQHPKPSGLQKTGALAVPLRLLVLEMLTAVDFDHQLQILAAEIQDVRPERVLAPKLRACQLA